MLRPLRDRIVVRPIPRPHSAIIEVVAKDNDNLGTVLRTGPKVTGVKRGDTVRFGSGEGYLSFPPFIENGERLLVMQEADVCFVEE